MRILSKILHNKTARNGTLFSVYSFLNSGISFILLIVIAKYIDPEGYGYLNLFNTIVTLLGFCISLNTAGVISVNFFRQNKEDFKKTVKAVSNITCLCALGLVIITLLFQERLIDYTGLPLTCLLIAIANSLSSAYSQILLNIWRIEEKIAMYGIFSIAMALVNFVLCILIVVVLNENWQGQINAYFLCNTIFCVLGIYGLIRKSYLTNVKPEKNIYKDCFKFGIPLIPHNISVWLRQGLDRMFINNYLSVEQVGLFGFSLNFANILIMLGSAFNNTITVYIFKNLSTGGEEVRQKLKKQTVWIIAMFFCATFLIWMLSYLIVPIFFPNYKDCLPYILPQCIGAFFQCVYLQFVNYLFYYKKTKGLMYITFSVSILHLLLSFTLTQYSIYYTIWIGVISNGLITLAVYFYSRKQYKIF